MAWLLSLSRQVEPRFKGRRYRGSPQRRRRQRADREYRAFVRAELERSPWCRVCPRIVELLGELPPYLESRVHRAEGLHHRRKVSAGGARCLRANVVPSCNAANTALESDADLMRALAGTDLIVRSGDPEWHELGEVTGRG